MQQVACRQEVENRGHVASQVFARTLAPSNPDRNSLLRAKISVEVAFTSRLKTVLLGNPGHLWKVVRAAESTTMILERYELQDLE